MLALRRVAAVSAVSRRAIVGRTYVTGRTEGSVAESKGFSKKEKAHEDQYVHKHELEQIQKLRNSIDKKKAELAKLEAEEAHLHETAAKK